MISTTLWHGQTVRSLAVGGMILACSGSGLPPPQQVSGNNYDSHAAEDQLAVAPDGTIAIAWIEIGTSQGISYRASTDGGKTFGASLGMSYPAPGLVASDPALAVDAAGNFYAAFLGVHEGASGPDWSRVYVAKAAAGTGVFAPAVEISVANNTTIIYDHPKIFVTSAGSILVGYAAYASFTATTSQGIVTRSTDGTSWSTTVAIDQPESANMLWFCEGTGNVFLAFLGATTTTYAGLRKSSDDGTTWSTTTVHASLDTDLVGQADVGCVASGSDVSVLYITTAERSADATTLDVANGVFVAHSGDGGSSFDPQPVPALDTPAGSVALLPVLTREASGRLDVTYVSGHAVNDPTATVRVDHIDATAVSPSVEVDGPLLFDQSRISATWLGDYLGAVVHDDVLYVAYPRNDVGVTNIHFAEIALQ